MKGTSDGIFDAREKLSNQNFAIASYEKNRKLVMVGEW